MGILHGTGPIHGVLIIRKIYELDCVETPVFPGRPYSYFIFQFLSQCAGYARQGMPKKFVAVVSA